MADMKDIVGGILDIITDGGVQKTILGKYSDGSPRSLFDALDGEVFSPKDRAKYLSRNKKKKKKKKKKGKIAL